MRESALEQRLRVKVKSLGGLALKFVSPGYDSVPDRLVLYRGKCWLVEVKRLGKEPTPKQQIRHKELLKLGFKVEVVNSHESLYNFLKLMTQ